MRLPLWSPTKCYWSTVTVVCNRQYFNFNVRGFFRIKCYGGIIPHRRIPRLNICVCEGQKGGGQRNVTIESKKFNKNVVGSELTSHSASMPAPLRGSNI
jgi:hypothetical protein